MKSEIQELLKISKSLKVLYVEDNEEARNSTLTLLSRFFDDVTVGVDGLDGLNKFKESKNLDLIITDINMPQVDGIEMVKNIREFDNNIAILMLSANNESSYFLDAIKLDIDGYLLKPLNMKQLVKQLTKTTEKVTLIKENEEYKKSLELKVEERTKALKHSLLHDELTKLKNQNALLEDLKNQPFSSLCILDIDNLQDYSDIYGLSGSSEIIKSFANLLELTLKDSSYDIYYFQSNQFILRGNDDFQDSIELLLKEIEFFEINLTQYNESIQIDTTVGISFEKEYAIEKALMALSYAKKHKKFYMKYSSIIDSAQNSKKTIAWKNDIKSAIKNSKIIPVFQPIVNKEQKIIKHEVLMRMEKEKDGKAELISPFFFLDIAMKTKQYKYLTKTMAEKSFQTIQTKSGDFSFNISFEDIIHTPTITMLKELISKYDIGSKLIFEIVESENIEDYKVVKNFISDFRKLGVKIAIDDFGAGFSNFEHILEIEPDYLKIDGSMIKNIDSSKKSYEFVKSIVSLTKALGIKTIAEFVHSKEVFDVCYKLGVDEFQGYYFSPPVTKPLNTTKLAIVS